MTTKTKTCRDKIEWVSFRGNTYLSDGKDIYRIEKIKQSKGRKR